MSEMSMVEPTLSQGSWGMGESSRTRREKAARARGVGVPDAGSSRSNSAGEMSGGKRAWSGECQVQRQRGQVCVGLC